MEKRKVCIIGQFPPPIHGLSKALDTLYEGLKAEFELETIDIKDNKKILFNLWKIFRSQADVFYFTISQSKGGNRRDLLILNLIARKKKKCLVHLHGGYYRQMLEAELGKGQREKNYRAIKNLDGAIVLSRSLQPLFRGMLPEEKIFVVHNCVDDEYLLSSTQLQEKIRLLPQKSVLNVLYLSNFIPEKGYKEVLALAQCEKLRAQTDAERRFHFHFAGAFFSETEKKFFFDYIERNALQDFITYHGVVEGDKKREILKYCHIFVLLTRYPKEGQPISVLEAMGNGMAIVTTDHAAIPDMVEEGVGGIVCKEKEEKDTQALYTRMLELSQNLSKIALHNFEMIQKEYSKAQYLHRLKSLFTEI